MQWIFFCIFWSGAHFSNSSNKLQTATVPFKQEKKYKNNIDWKISRRLSVCHLFYSRSYIWLLLKKENSFTACWSLVRGIHSIYHFLDFRKKNYSQPWKPAKKITWNFEQTVALSNLKHNDNQWKSKNIYSVQDLKSGQTIQTLKSRKSRDDKTVKTIN